MFIDFFDVFCNLFVFQVFVKILFFFPPCRRQAEIFAAAAAATAAAAAVAAAAATTAAAILCISFAHGCRWLLITHTNGMFIGALRISR